MGYFALAIDVRRMMPLSRFELGTDCLYIVPVCVLVQVPMVCVVWSEERTIVRVQSMYALRISTCAVLCSALYVHTFPRMVRATSLYIRGAYILAFISDNSQVVHEQGCSRVEVKKTKNCQAQKEIAFG